MNSFIRYAGACVLNTNISRIFFPGSFSAATCNSLCQNNQNTNSSDNSSNIPYCDGTVLMPIGYTCPYGCSEDACLLAPPALKGDGEVCSSDFECESGNCDYDIFTENNVKGNINAGTSGSPSAKYCHADSSKCLFYSGSMEENDVGCTRCASWVNNGSWDSFIDTCGKDSHWSNYVHCTGSTPYCSSKTSEGRCDVTCVECNKDDQCSGSNSKCVNNKCSSSKCTSSCTNKQCGDDGCGGICGICSSGYACDTTGKCNLLNAEQCTFENPKDLVGNSILISKFYFGNDFNYYAGTYCQVEKHCSGYDPSSVVVKDDAVKACRCDSYWGCSGDSCIFNVSSDSQWERVGSVTCTGCPVGVCNQTNQNTTCTDSDNSTNNNNTDNYNASLYVKGTTSFNGTSFTDYCESDIYGNVYLREYHCVGNIIRGELETCPNGCVDGACELNNNLPRVAFWGGKVNQHIENGTWVTDPDGKSGSFVDILTYCKKWYPKTLSFREYKMETITGWRDFGNLGGPYTSTQQSYDCVQGVACVPDCSGKECGDDGCGGFCGICLSGKTCNSNGQCVVDLTPRIAYWYGKVNQHVDSGSWVTDSDRTNGADIDILTYCQKWYPDTVSVKEYKLETITTWRDAFGGGPYTSTQESYECVPACDCVNKNCGDDGCGGSCGTCSVGYICNAVGNCVEHPIPNTKNKKDISYYSNKEIFLISDKNWEDVLQLIPLTTWTKQEGDDSKCQGGYGTPDNVCVYPTLIYHENEMSSLYIPTNGNYVSETSIPVGAQWNGPITLIGTKVSKTSNFERGDIISFTVTLNVSDSSGNINYLQITSLPNFLEFVKPLDGIIKKEDINNLKIGENSFEFTLRVKEDANTDIIKLFDADSIIYFMQQYAPAKVTIVGETPQDLDNLLVAQPDLGAGLTQNQIQRISVNDYLSYWNSYKDVVYVEDNYFLVLMASTYASLLNAPLIIRGSTLDVDSVFKGRNIICVGNVDRDCNENYNLEQLQQEYVKMTHTDKSILVNPDDLNMKFEAEFQPDKSNEKIYDLYSKTSLASSILASAKHEIIIGTTATDYKSIGDFVKYKINELMPWVINNSTGIKNEAWYPLTSIEYDYFIYGFLTIFSAPNAIPSREYVTNLGGYMLYRALDQSEYGDIYNGDNQPDLAVGRIQGITLSDVSGYVARDLFYDKIDRTDNMQFMVQGIDFGYNMLQIDNWTKTFNNIGYNAKCADPDNLASYYYNTFPGRFIFICNTSSSDLHPNLWKDKDLIMYIDHGSEDWAGIYYTEIPQLSDSIVYANACLTCASYNGKSFCNNAIRKGSLGFMGAVSVATDGDATYKKTIDGIYAYGLTLGQSFSKAYTFSGTNYMDTLLGDPALNLNPKYALKEELPWEVRRY